MLSQVSLILAELKLRKLEEIIIRNFKNIIMHWFRLIYMIDIFTLIKEDCIIENIINE